MAFIFNELFIACFTVMGKSAGQRENFHGHVTALSVAPEYRRLGLAVKLMKNLEDVSVKLDNVAFSDITLGTALYRSSNQLQEGLLLC
mgnify:CR=1 FL=1